MLQGGNRTIVTPSQIHLYPELWTEADCDRWRIPDGDDDGDDDDGDDYAETFNEAFRYDGGAA
jgi:hypothetical protein